jgi:hypothetical protein
MIEGAVTYLDPESCYKKKKWVVLYSCSFEVLTLLLITVFPGYFCGHLVTTIARYAP